MINNEESIYIKLYNDENIQLIIEKLIGNKLNITLDAEYKNNSNFLIELAKDSKWRPVNDDWYISCGPYSYDRRIPSLTYSAVKKNFVPSFGDAELRFSTEDLIVKGKNLLETIRESEDSSDESSSVCVENPCHKKVIVTIHIDKVLSINLLKRIGKCGSYCPIDFKDTSVYECSVVIVDESPNPLLVNIFYDHGFLVLSSSELK